MVSTQERLQDINRELDALGTVPEQLTELIVRYREVGPGPDEADEALWELQQGLDIPDSGTAEQASPRPGMAEAAESMRAEAEKRQQERAELAAMVEQQLSGATQDRQEARAEPGLDEVSLFANIESDEDDVQEEPVLAAGSEPPGGEVDSDFKQVLKLDIDPSVFPAGVPPGEPSETSAEAKDDFSGEGGEAEEAEGGEAEEAEGAAGGAEPEVDELDEEFLALLDEDVIELEDE
jgi:hypothetical protein